MRQNFKQLQHGFLVAAVAALILALAAPAEAARRYVDADAAPGGNGQEWATAFRYLQDALEFAQNGDEIWVAQGTYYPDDGLDGPPRNRLRS